MKKPLRSKGLTGLALVIIFYIMNIRYVVLASFFFLIALGAKSLYPPTPIELEYPEYWPAPVYKFENNPLSKEGVALGRRLFYDSVLSKDSTVNCSNCHLSFSAFTHVDHALSHGIGDSIGNRNSPALMNLAWTKTFMWDGAVNHLDVQALAPIHDVREMGGDIADVVKRLEASTAYRERFSLAFGDDKITGERVLKALTQFQLTLISANSKYDKVKREEEEFTAQETRGYAIFQANCASCHQEPLFTTSEFANNGLPIDSTLMDFGRMTITQHAGDSLLFKIPTLRNVEFSFPYMHDGRFKKLSQVVKHYSEGIAPSKTLSPELRNGIKLTDKERVDLLAFLLTLSDKEFLFNPDFSFPR